MPIRLYIKYKWRMISMENLRNVGARSTYTLIQLYALMKKAVPDFRFIYINPSDQIRTLTLSDYAKIIVYTPWNYKLMSPDGVYLESEDLSESDMASLSDGFDKYDCKYKLDLNKIVQSIQDNDTSYYVAENIENLKVCDFRDIISKRAFLCDGSCVIMDLKLTKYKSEINIDRKLMTSLLGSLSKNDDGISGYLPYTLLREYTWTTLHENKKFKLPYIAPSKSIRSLVVPKCGIGDILIFTKSSFDIYDNKQKKLYDVFEQRGVFSKVYNMCYEIPYWDFMKLMVTTFRYTVVDRTTGELVDFKSILYPIAVMTFKGRTTDKLRNMYISLTA